MKIGGGKKGQGGHQSAPCLTLLRLGDLFDTSFLLLHVFKHKFLKIGSLCIGFRCTGRFVLFIFYILLDHLDLEGDAAQVLIPFVVVAQVRALYPALYLQLLVVVLLSQQQLHGHQGLQVIVLHGRRRRAFVRKASPRGRLSWQEDGYLHGPSCRSRGSTSYQSAPCWGNTVFGRGRLAVKKSQ